MKKHLLSAVILSTITTVSAFAIESAEQRIYTGSRPESAFVADAASFKSARSQRIIREILREEERARTVGEAMAVKRSGLRYVEDMADFELLSTFTVSSPSEAYQRAVAEFILDYVGAYVISPRDIPYIQSLETRILTVGGAIQLKVIGMQVVRREVDFLRLIQFSVRNPSDAYRRATSEFVADYVREALDRTSRIRLILEIEKFTMTVADAMRVKNAGLIAVYRRAELFELAEYTVSSPSDAYRRAVNEFISDNIGRYPR